MEEQEKKVIAYFDFVPIHALAEYLNITPKEVYNIYSEIIDKRERFKYRRAALKDLNIPLLNGRLRRLTLRLEVRNDC